jgi:hypothetical protein
VLKRKARGGRSSHGPEAQQKERQGMQAVTFTSSIDYGSWIGAVQISSLALLRRSVHDGKNLPA